MVRIEIESVVREEKAIHHTTKNQKGGGKKAMGGDHAFRIGG